MLLGDILYINYNITNMFVIAFFSPLAQHLLKLIWGLSQIKNYNKYELWQADEVLQEQFNEHMIKSILNLFPKM